MTTPADHPRSRRSLLAAGAAVAAAAVVETVHPPSASAGTGTMSYGAVNNATDSPTTLTSIADRTMTVNNTSAYGDGLRTFANGVALSGVSANAGYACVYGTASLGIGVLGDAGQAGASAHTAGVWGRHLGGADGVGVYGSTATLTGVYGYAADGEAPSPTTVPAMTGVYGYAPTGQGVRGVTASGIGVRGFASSGIAASFETTTGMALVTKGRVRFQQIAGKASITAGTNSITVTPGVDLTSGSSVLATLNGNPGAGVSIHRVSINTTSNQFTIFLTANSASTISVAWFVLDQ
jgi:hypothetical protein